MLMGYSIRKELGFSLVELLVAIALIAVLVGLGVPSYQEWIESTRIRSAAESIQGGLQLARAEAVKRNTQVQFVFAENSGWTVGCVVPLGDLDGDGVSDCPNVIQSRKQSEGSSASVAVLTDPVDQASVIFSNLGSVMPASFTSVQVSSSASSSSRVLRVTVGVGGNVRMCDPAVDPSSTDSRKC
jgi:type IV fimbrial biogenesis protein FimT